MNWMVYALAAPALATMVNFVDKLVVETRVRHAYVIAIYICITNLVLGVVLWLLTGMPLLDWQIALPLVAGGILWPLSGILYFTALAGTETSRIIVIGQMSPVWVLLLSALFLGETIAARQLLGFALVLVASIGISLRRGAGGMQISQAFWLLLLAGIIRAVNITLTGGAVSALRADGSFHSVLVSVAYLNAGVGIGGLLTYLLVAPVRQKFNHEFITARFVPFALFGLSEGILLVARSVTFMAIISGGEVALVTVLTGTQPFYAILYGALLTRLAPGTFHEDIRAAELLRKFAWGVLMLLGTIFMS